jgi:hypothetical protein
MNPTTWELRTTHNKLGCHSRRPAAAAALRGTRPVGRAPATAETLAAMRAGNGRVAESRGWESTKEGIGGDPAPRGKEGPTLSPREGGRSVIPPGRVGARLHLRKALGQAWEWAGRGIGFQLRGDEWMLSSDAGRGPEDGRPARTANNKVAASAHCVRSGVHGAERHARQPRNVIRQPAVEAEQEKGNRAKRGLRREEAEHVRPRERARFL